MVGEQLEQAANLAAATEQRENDDGCDAEGVAGFEIHARIGLRVVATQKLAAGNALSGQSGANLQARADSWGAGAGAGAADHLISLWKSERGTGGSGDVLRALDEKLERGVKFALAEDGKIGAIGQGRFGLGGSGHARHSGSG